MSDYRVPVQTGEMIRHQQAMWQARDTADAAKETARLLRAMAEHQAMADEREQKMLWWTRVSGIAAIAAAVLAIAAILVTVGVA